jgi:hypothetical protein
LSAAVDIALAVGSGDGGGPGFHQRNDWVESSFRHYAKNEVGPVEIESQWTARRREQAGIFPVVRKHPARLAALYWPH